MKIEKIFNLKFLPLLGFNPGIMCLSVTYVTTRPVRLFADIIDTQKFISFSKLKTYVRGCVDTLFYGNNIPTPEMGNILFLYFIYCIHPYWGVPFIYFIYFSPLKRCTKYYVCLKMLNSTEYK